VSRQARSFIDTSLILEECNSRHKTEECGQNKNKASAAEEETTTDFKIMDAEEDMQQFREDLKFYYGDV
jgi:hypothetical protein